MNDFVKVEYLSENKFNVYQGIEDNPKLIPILLEAEVI